MRTRGSSPREVTAGRTLLAIVVTVLVVIGVAAAITYFHHPLFNPRFAEFPRIAWLHVVLGGIYLALAPLQFLTGGRRCALGYHRWIGRMLVAGAAVVGATAIFITAVIPGGGWLERMLVDPFAVFFLVGLAKSVQHIHARRVALHREWMIRAFAIGLGISTQRVLFVVLAMALIGGKPAPDQIVLLMSLSFAAAFVLHAAAAEAWIRAGRSPSRPV